MRYAETDQMGVVHHRNYLVWCELGRTEHFRKLGASYSELERSGVVLAVAEANVRYAAPARYDDRIRVDTRVSAVGSRGVTFEYTIYRADDGVRLASARTTLVALDRSGRVITLPSHVRQALARDLAPAPA